VKNENGIVFDAADIGDSIFWIILSYKVINIINILARMWMELDIIRHRLSFFLNALSMFALYTLKNITGINARMRVVDGSYNSLSYHLINAALINALCR
jgi:hypothetical protein